MSATSRQCRSPSSIRCSSSRQNKPVSFFPDHALIVLGNRIRLYGCQVVSMRILFVGDIVGRSGRTVVVERLPKLIRDWKLDLVIANGENAAGGFGITQA